MAGQSRELFFAVLLSKKRRMDRDKLRVAKMKARRRRMKEFNNMQCEEGVLFLLMLIKAIGSGTAGTALAVPPFPWIYLGF